MLGDQSAILPGRTIGILGGGQLGRMFAIAARRLGYRVHAFDPTDDCPTGQVADREVNSDYDDMEAARRFATGVDVVTFEFENVPAETLSVIEKVCPVRPAPRVLDICRHRLREKDFLSGCGFPVTRYLPVHSPAELGHALAELAGPAILKTADYGYDGKGQVRIERPPASTGELADLWARMGRPVGILEAVVPFRKELSVIVARTLTGATESFPVCENVHRRHILDTTVMPAEVPESVAKSARELAVAIADALGVVGLLTVEMFLVCADEFCPGRLLVNELAPRPHNSGHASFDFCVTSQFEQQLRAVCGLPLGQTDLLAPAAAMANLLGELWADGEPNWSAALADPRVKLHLYGKRQARPGRKMGHLTAAASTRADALSAVTRARAALMSRA